MLVLTWNIHGNRGITPSRRSELVARLAARSPALVLLQEVGADFAEDLVADLARHGLSAHFGGSSDDKKYGNIIAARGALRPAALHWNRAPYPHLLTRATVTIDGREIDVISAHVPNGSGNGWRKIDTLDALSAELDAAPRTPRIVGGDFNEPRTFRGDGTLVSFGAKKPSKPGDPYSYEGDRRCDVTPKLDPSEDHSRKRWQRAVERALAKGAPHGLRHAVGERHGFEPLRATHEVQKKPRWFDHLLVAEHFTIDNADHDDESRTSKLSDHAAVWAELALHSDGAC